MPERRMSILIVDDNEAARERIHAALGDQYALTFARNAEEAFHAVQCAQPDLMVSEIDLEDGDGLALCGRVRSLPQGARLPIMLVTSRASINDRVAGFNAGADDYVVKPVDVRLFSARVRLLCRIKGIERPRDLGA